MNQFHPLVHRAGYRSQCSGLTLIEVMVALVIAATVFTACYTLLQKCVLLTKEILLSHEAIALIENIRNRLLAGDLVTTQNNIGTTLGEPQNLVWSICPKYNVRYAISTVTITVSRINEAEPLIIWNDLEPQL